MTARKQSIKKGGRKGMAEGSKQKLTAEQAAHDADAIAYAKKAYDAALAHYYANKDDAFALSRLAVVYDEQQPGDVHMVVTLPGVLSQHLSEPEAREAIRNAELLARTLEHPDCTDAFKRAFGLILTEHILDGSAVDWTTPTVVRVMLPLALFQWWSVADARGMTETDILITLSSELVSDEVDRDVRKSLGMQ